MNKRFIAIAKTVLVTGSLFGFVAAAGATTTWTPPSAAAPSGNTDAPINVSSSTQTKAGVLAVTGFSNWGVSFLQGKVAIGGTTAPGTATSTPALTVNGVSGSFPALYVPNGDSTFNGALNIIGGGSINMAGGSINMTGAGSNHFTENGSRVCLQSGAGCPSATALVHDTTLTGSGTTASPLSVAASGGSGDSFWIADPSNTNNIYSTNSGNVGIGGSPSSRKLYVWGVTRLGDTIDYGTAQVLSVAPGQVNFDAPGVGGGRLAINGTTGEVTIGTNLKVAGQNVCLQNGTNCPTAVTVYKLNPRCSAGSTTAGSDVQGEITFKPWCVGTGTYSGWTWWNDVNATFPDVVSGAAVSYSRGAVSCTPGQTHVAGSTTFYSNCSWSTAAIGHLSP